MGNEHVAPDPFRCYLGRHVVVHGRVHVVETRAVVGRELKFTLRDRISGSRAVVSMLELLELEPG